MIPWLFCIASFRRRAGVFIVSNATTKETKSPISSSMQEKIVLPCKVSFWIVFIICLCIASYPCQTESSQSDDPRGGVVVVVVVGKASEQLFSPIADANSCMTHLQHPLPSPFACFFSTLSMLQLKLLHLLGGMLPIIAILFVQIDTAE
ncbi:MAG: hypothetical protein J3Q66DRAFT_125394 [Benniella sp.]|nr:MAG: hypothetical protein J3Q66DRAFT_125394 [Benniella sp.]